MVCPECGSTVEKGAKICPTCCAQLNFGETENRPTYSMNSNSYSSNQGNSTVDYGKSLINADESMIGMKWAYFLGYFCLWASAILLLKDAFSIFNGSYYGNAVMEELVYYLFPKMESLNKFYAITNVLVAVLYVVCAICIIGRKRLTIKLVPASYIIAGACSLIYELLKPRELNDIAGNGALIWIVIGLDIAIFVANYIYFRNRDMIFKN